MLIVIAACAGICLAQAAAVADAAFPGDNGRIAYTRTLDSGASDLFSVEPSGFAEIRLTHDGQSDNGAFSPDGARFAYSSGTAIHIADQYGNDPELVLDTGVGVGEIDWSPDGTQLVASIMNCAEFDCEYDIYVVGTDGSGLTNLTGTLFSENNPSWSPDGSKIAFDAAVAGEEDVYTINPDGTGLENLTLVEPAESAREPDWSPDGSRIVFTYFGTSNRTMSPDGTGQVAGGAGTASAWSPDGTAFTSNTHVQSTLVQGGSPGQPGSVHDPDWQVRPPQPDPDREGSGYPRPKGATPFDVPLVSAFHPCPFSSQPNTQHGPPLAYPSCSPPRRAGPFGAVFGTPDSNGYVAEGRGNARFHAILGVPATPEDEADVGINVSLTDVHAFAPSVGHPDFPGNLLLEARLQVTDRWNSGGTDGSATMAEFPLRSRCLHRDAGRPGREQLRHRDHRRRPDGRLRARGQARGVADGRRGAGSSEGLDLDPYAIADTTSARSPAGCSSPDVTGRTGPPGPTWD